MPVRGQRFLAKPANFALHAADVRDDGTGAEMRRDLTDQRYDLIDGRTDDDQLRVADGVGRRIVDLVAPRLAFELKSGFRTAGPQGNVFGDSVMTGGPGDRGAEEAGCENGNSIKHKLSEKVRGRIVEPA